MHGGALAGVPSASPLATWDDPRLRRLSARLVLCSLLLLPLSAAATIDVGFTLTLSYLLAVCAVAVGLPSVVSGVLRLPRPLVFAGAALLLVYILGVIFGSDLGLASQPGRSRFRDVVYLVDLALGLALVVLLVDLVARTLSLRRTISWLCAGSAAVALYAIYQWLAQHYGWPGGDLNNTVNSDGVTTGRRSQGPGLFGWERVRGTFKEPLLLASHLAISLPLVIGLIASARGRFSRVGWGCAVVAIAVALALTVSVLAVAAAVVATLAVASVWAVRVGAPRSAAVLGAVGVLVLVTGPVLFVNPSGLSTVTGRSAEALNMTSANRVDAWRRATTLWSQRPVAGYGPGQSSVRLAYRPDLGPGAQPTVALGSAQGLWAAALIDTGLIGLIAWLCLFGAAGAFALSALLTRGSPLLLACAVAGTTALVVSQMSGDRLDLRAWVALGLLVATSSLLRERDPGEGHGEPD